MMIYSYIASQGGRGAVTPGVTLASGWLQGGSRELSGTCHAGEGIGNSLPAARMAPAEGDVNRRPSDPTPTHARGQDDVSITRKLPHNNLPGPLAC